jgi:hypothetical protein
MKPKVIVFDIETFPAVVETWGSGMYEQDVIRVLKPWELASFAYKELGRKQVTCVTRQGEATDKNLVKKLWQVLNDADVVIAHNGDKFDMKKSNTRIIKSELLPYSPGKTIDTLKIAKRHFAFTSNRLNDLGVFLGVGKKAETPRGLWDDCRADKPAAWRLMEKYNKQDVRLLEKVYLKLRPWAEKHPHMGERNEEQCPKCGSKEVQKRGFMCSAQGVMYRRLQCQGCGGWCRSRVADKDKKRHGLVNGG